MAQGKEKIAVLGGGIGALAAAYYLTEQPGAADRYEITVYQQGWRLGGKCASGHDMRPGYGDRIYEHGLHIFAGFYDQAFDLLGRAYQALERPADHPNRTVWDAFTPEDSITLVDHSFPEHPNLMWFMDFPPNDNLPGDSLEIAPLIVMIQRMVAMLLHVSVPHALQKSSPPVGGELSRLGAGPLENPLEKAVHFAGEIARKVLDKDEDIAVNAMLHELVHMIEKHMGELKARKQDVATWIEIERVLYAAFLVQTLIHGIAEDDVIEQGYNSLDNYEWSEWLFKNAVHVAQKYPEWGDAHARAQDLIDWAPMSTMYDYVFGFGNGGDPGNRSFGAGTSLRSGMLMISYKGHFFWKMRGAMGDVVIAPLYLALLKRGVRFRFFRRITSLNIDPVHDRLASIDYVRQVEMAASDPDYQPIINVQTPGWPKHRPLEGWPAEPLWDQLKDGARLKADGRDFEADTNPDPGPGDVPGQLRLGVDFDRAVVGISVGGLKQVCASFPSRLPASNWGPMFGALTLTRTCAMQLWLTRTMEDLGATSVNRTLTGSDQPYSSWSDMGHLLARENWNGENRPRAIAYFCGQIPGDEPPGSANAKAKALAVKWLSDNSGLYWPRATAEGSPFGLDPTLIYDPDPDGDGDILDRQYIRANCNPSDLYVQSPKNSVQTRMDADQSGLGNLYLAGDWTLNGLNSGCAEAAARSGWRCAQAIAGMLQPHDE
jgi:uncharacterized protein with NAD-binding domain and iron-sulfur cluster